MLKIIASLLKTGLKNPHTDLAASNSAIMGALEDGYKQAEVARYLGLTASAVAKVRKNRV